MAAERNNWIYNGRPYVHGLNFMSFFVVGTDRLHQMRLLLA